MFSLLILVHRCSSKHDCKDRLVSSAMQVVSSFGHQTRDTLMRYACRRKCSQTPLTTVSCVKSSAASDANAGREFVIEHVTVELSALIYVGGAECLNQTRQHSRWACL